jgi:hypothetical protein
MSDRYEIYYTLESGWTSSELEALIERLRDRERLTHPLAPGASTQSDETAPSDPVDRYVAELASETGYVGISLDAPGLDCSLIYTEAESGAFDFPHFNVSVQDHHFFRLDGEDDRDAVERIDTLYTFLAAFYDDLVALGRTPLSVHGLEPIEYDKAVDPDHGNGITAERIRSGELPGIYWCQILPPRLVERIGADELLSVPAFRSERLSDGAVLLVVTHAMNTETLPPENHAPNVVSERLGLEWRL